MISITETSLPLCQKSSLFVSAEIMKCLSKSLIAELTLLPLQLLTPFQIPGTIYLSNWNQKLLNLKKSSLARKRTTIFHYMKNGPVLLSIVLLVISPTPPHTPPHSHRSPRNLITEHVNTLLHRYYIDTGNLLNIHIHSM